MQPTSDVQNNGDNVDTNKPLVVEIAGFQIDHGRKCAVKEVMSASGSKFKVTIPLKDDNFEEYLKNFPSEFCQKIADLSVAMDLGKSKQGSDTHLSRIGLKVNFLNGSFETLSKGYSGQKEGKVISDPMQHYSNKLGALDEGHEKYSRLEKIVNVFLQLIHSIPNKEEWSLFDNDEEGKGKVEAKPADGISRKNKKPIPEKVESSEIPKPAADKVPDVDAVVEPIEEDKPWYSRWYDKIANWF